MNYQVMFTSVLSGVYQLSRSLLVTVSAFAMLFSLATVLSVELAFAQGDHQLIRRVAVFPIRSASGMAESADEAWWQMREQLANDKRFLVASKSFLLQKDVYQARGALKPADAIILGKLLDAHALVTAELKGRILHMYVYEGEYGRLLWEFELALHPSLSISSQLASAAVKLTRDFIAAIPYQGFVLVEAIQGKAVYKDGKRLMLKASVGSSAEVDANDSVQVVRVFSENLKPLFTSGPNIEVLAEGRVVAKDRDLVTVELERVVSSAVIQEGSLIRLPRELKRLQQEFAMQDYLHKRVDPQFLNPEMTSYKQEIEEKKPLMTSLMFIGNLAAFLLLAL